MCWQGLHPFVGRDTQRAASLPMDPLVLHEKPHEIFHILEPIVPGCCRLSNVLVLCINQECSTSSRGRAAYFHKRWQLGSYAITNWRWCFLIHENISCWIGKVVNINVKYFCWMFSFLKQRAHENKLPRTDGIPQNQTDCKEQFAFMVAYWK